MTYHSDDDDADDRHPLDAAVAQAQRRKEQSATGEPEAGGRTKDATQHEQQQQQQDRTGSKLKRAAEGAQQEEQEEEDQAEAPGGAEPQKKKRKKKKRRKDGDGDNDGGTVEGSAGAEQLLQTPAAAAPAPAAEARQRAPESAPGRLEALVQQLASAGGLQFVDDSADIVQSFELRRILRPPRYWEEDAGLPEPSTKRCFNCGQVWCLQGWRLGGVARVPCPHARVGCLCARTHAQMGHFASTCTNATRDKPCHLCAQLGHEGWCCPNRECATSV